MKKLIPVLLALCLALFSFAGAETLATPGELQEGDMYFHGYRSEFGGYYIGMPAEWAPIGANSPAQYIEQAEEILDYITVRDILTGLNEKNDVLIAVSPSGASMTLSYGPAEGATNESLIEEAEAIQAELTKAYPGIQFSQDCGSYSINELNSVLYIGANYLGNAIHQYYLSVGGNVFVITFTGVQLDIAQAVISTFQMV